MMNVKNKVCWCSIMLGLTACALTPEQRAAQQAAEWRVQQQLAVSLAAQCDPAAARLMQAQMQADSAQNAAEAEAYRQTVGNPVFQRCYQLAWENHLNQVRLQAADQALRRREYDDWWGPWPFACRGYRYCGW